MAFERPNQKLIAKRAGEIGEQRNIQRFSSVDAEGVDIFGVVGISHAAAEAGAQPVVLLAEGDLVVEQAVGGVSLDKAPIVDCGNRALGDCGLDIRAARGWIVGDRKGAYILIRQRLGQCVRVAGGRGSFVKLATHMDQKPARGSVAADSGVVIEAVLVRTAVVIDDGRAEMIAVAQRRAADAARQGVDRLHPQSICRGQTLVLSVIAQLAAQRPVDFFRFVCEGP